MTDKEKKNKIANILLDFYDEYHSNEINRPMIPSIYAGKILDSMPEDPVSADLEEEAEKYLEEHIDGGSATERNGFKTWGKYIARHFAEWQKQQIMKNAKSGVVKADYQIAMDDGLWLDLDPCMQLTPVLDVNPGDKVTIIAIKEE